MKATVLESSRLIFRPISYEHVSQDYVDWMNDPDVIRYLESGGDYSLSKLENYISDMVKRDVYFWGIHLKESNLHIGNIKIDPVVEKHGRAEYGILMGRKSEWGKGFAKESTNKILAYCFETLGLRKITLGVVTENKAAHELYKKLDFIQEGIYKSHSFHEGKYCDVIRMAKFNPGFSIDQ